MIDIVNICFLISLIIIDKIEMTSFYSLIKILLSSSIYLFIMLKLFFALIIMFYLSVTHYSLVLI